MGAPWEVAAWPSQQSSGTGRGKEVTFLGLRQCLLQPRRVALGLGALVLGLAQPAAQAHRLKVPVVLGGRTQGQGAAPQVSGG